MGCGVWRGFELVEADADGAPTALVGGASAPKPGAGMVPSTTSATDQSRYQHAASNRDAETVKRLSALATRADANANP